MKELILSLVQNVLLHWGLTDYMPGKVVEISPFKVSLDERLILESNNLIFVTDSSTLKLGDSLIMLRVLRGQKYLILGKEGI